MNIQVWGSYEPIYWQRFLVFWLSTKISHNEAKDNNAITFFCLCSLVHSLLLALKAKYYLFLFGSLFIIRYILHLNIMPKGCSAFQWWWNSCPTTAREKPEKFQRAVVSHYWLRRGGWVSRVSSAGMLCCNPTTQAGTGRCTLFLKR